ncbi:sugar phosphate isomerase/epimerase family protein [Sporomusa acidovorans]|uniref:Xylose isomerase-like TIM barrel domain-containing protein n=1 Tax=Sporomusa acidovorans (strain ATCC 49682 / DSM 3132 / Mol) TaxID=1123286 RepID=A0ABZ3J5W6_SPOA4|nr:sugar phosphate isomerase/epimerase [Sporomusa acidovorans]OZC21047.1 endonuclease 4 [Sporomusa acidovorans DSM 3132]SDF17563.1 Sugar phosphate isomerase/epimerase [Sporomusa acidovorans]
MIAVGIFNGYFPYTLEESIKKIKSLGFNCVQLDLSFKGMDLSSDALNKEKCHVIRDAFRDANLPIVAISGYTNIIHPNPAKRQQNLNYLKTLLKFARDLGTPYVISETGTYNQESDWVYDPKNGTEEAFAEVSATIKELAQYAYDNGAEFLVENYVNNVIGSVEQVLRLFAEVNHPGLGLLMDPTNYFSDHNIGKVDGELNRIFNALGDKIKIAHAKDCKKAEDVGEKHANIDASESHTFRGAGAVELPAPGLGILNYDLYLKRLSALHSNIPIIIEHLDESDVPRAKAFLDAKLKKVGC